MRKLRNGTGARGFTLLEILVAVTIMVIISLMLIGGTNALIANQKFTSSSDRIISSLHLARNLAITHNAIYHVRIQNYMISNGQDDFQQGIGVYCYPRANDALSIQRLNRLTGQPDVVDPELYWNPRGSSEGLNLRNYRVAYSPLEKGVYVGIQEAPAVIDPATQGGAILYFLPDGTASSSQTLFITNQVMLRDNPKESAWVWKDRNDVRRALHNGNLGGYSPPPAPPEAPGATSTKDILPPNTDIHMIQVYQGGMIRFLKQERLP